MASPDMSVPTYDQLLWPTVSALRDLGGSGAISEINERVIEFEEFDPGQQAQLHGDGPQTEIEYRLAWARSYLKMMGLVDNSSRGVWTLLELGRSVDKSDIPEIHSKVKRDKQFQAAKKVARKLAEKRLSLVGERVAPENDEGDQEIAWKDELLETIMKMPPDAFERLAQRLLREAGFISVNVTGGSGDGGIDGLGIYRISLVSFPVFFQCKRYRGSVAPSAVRDFRGAMAGRGDKGLLITTGSFTAAAKKEATRDGAPPIDLIDGDRLCDLLREYTLGVEVEIVKREKITIDHSFFGDV
nr:MULTISPECIES: restriction endonuclease [Parafrankia]